MNDTKQTPSLAIEFGKPGEPPPPYVSHLSKVSQGLIVLCGGRRTASGHEFGNEIAFIDEGELWENDDLFSKLSQLNASGVPFSYQPKEMDSPDILMAYWHAIGRLKVSFREIVWRSSDHWYIATHEPPVLKVGVSEVPKSFSSWLSRS
ncbi:hypothetical protein [Pararhizobium arenae]|uniref:hypothetical protein n=1 Tax=Pararhizobium arenae TaxID=1856850 RepID=UPI0011799CED|nr:hypothetical protein [Pararhizobium arenae]